MTKTQITQEEALERIAGSLTDDGKHVIYYDDSMHQYYLAPIEDLAYLQDLMGDDDEDISRDAYSHWCAGTTHPECDDCGTLEHNMGELATRGLEIESVEIDGRIAYAISDGQFCWDCWADDYEAAETVLSRRPVPDLDDEAEAIAYDELCALVPYLKDTDSVAHDKLAKAVGWEGCNWS